MSVDPAEFKARMDKGKTDKAAAIAAAVAAVPDEFEWTLDTFGWLKVKVIKRDPTGQITVEWPADSEVKFSTLDISYYQDQKEKGNIR
jgi:hypothetical protein